MYTNTRIEGNYNLRTVTDDKKLLASTYIAHTIDFFTLFVYTFCCNFPDKIITKRHKYYEIVIVWGEWRYGTIHM